MRTIAAVLIAVMLTPAVGSAQAVVVPPDAWRELALRAGPGGEVQMQLADGTRFRAVVIRVDDSGVLLRPKTRLPVPVQAVPYGAIASMELPRKGGAGSVAKTVAIGVGTGVAAFWGMAMIAIAVWGD